MAHCSAMICQQVTLSGDAEWPKVADAVIEAPSCIKNLPQKGGRRWGAQAQHPFECVCPHQGGRTWPGSPAARGPVCAAAETAPRLDSPRARLGCQAYLVDHSCASRCCPLHTPRQGVGSSAERLQLRAAAHPSSAASTASLCGAACRGCRRVLLVAAQGKNGQEEKKGRVARSPPPHDCWSHPPFSRENTQDKI